MQGGKNILVDKWGRQSNYLRIAVTDRCNLRCFYCMPEEGIKYLPKKELLSYEELIRLTEIVSELGVNKVRITGGEPFIRRELDSFLYQINQIPGIDSVHITTNGVVTHKYLDQFEELGIKSVNLSLDTLNPDKFLRITRRNEFDNVQKTLHGLIDRGIPTKINMVVMEQQNVDDIIPMLELGKANDIDVRFIEEMPFNGDPAHKVTINWNHKKILDTITSEYPDIHSIDEEPSSTSRRFKVAGFAGSFGIIPAYSRTFCNTCNRLRITAQGTIKTCLYDDGVLDLKQHMRDGATNDQIKILLQNVVAMKSIDGFEAERNRTNMNIDESMSTIGG